MVIKKKMSPEDAREDHRRMLLFMGLNAGFGVFLGLLTTAALIFLDIGGLGSRIAHSSSPILPVILIAFPLSLTFGAAVTASAIWLMPYERRFHADPEKSPDQERGEGENKE